MTDPTSPHSLHLDERQRAMLHAMGVTHWWPTETAPAEAKSPATALPMPTAATQPPSPRPAQAPTAIDTQKIANNPARKSTEGQFGTLNSPIPSPSTPDPEAPRTDVSTMDWDELTQAISHCRACGLCQGRQHAVPGMGHRQARWMVVGEAPGEQEDRQGLPFVGPAGQLLDAMLSAMGLERERDVYIANVIKCRPPHNRNPEPSEVAQCQPYLRRQMALVQPDVILALGRFAAQSLLAGVVPDVERAPLGKLRGQVYTAAAIPVVVSYHPAYLLRNPADKGKVWEDLCLAMAHLGHNPLEQR